VQREAVLRLDEVRADQAPVAAVQEVERLVRHAGTLSTMSGYPYPGDRTKPLGSRAVAMTFERRGSHLL
jgi:hypothetical protein